ncbi:SDR family NAD(P)-dependent oxidoreductase [Actinomadura rudentiformis]|uniref:SDR family oxidoreductase n=1 Tax=Actinomadura rudentiformis TaxID=359158 RepID=A0A6H9YX43_9ACTN|nr:SDR family oxidoreductase [Actinomadura rudentiformis]KAB2346412.1 SDR family oxidoreductase [Actinomadura rudentiformis]
MGKVLDGKVALVTGGSRGIGAATARALADAGADVAISYAASADKAADVVRDLASRGVRADAYKADQSDPEQVAGLVEGVVADFGALDVLVNNAGVITYGGVGDEIDEAAFDHMYAVNIRGVVAGTRAAAKAVRDGGRIITVGSNLASRTSFPGMADYAATKAAIVAYAQGAARDLAPRGVTVNVVQSGSVATDMNPEDGPMADAQRAGNAMGRFGRPEEIAAGIVFLASPAASFVTGTVLTIDGGALA